MFAIWRVRANAMVESRHRDTHNWRRRVPLLTLRRRSNCCIRKRDNIYYRRRACRL